MYEIELPFGHKMIYKWDDMQPVVCPLLHDMFESGTVWYRTKITPITGYWEGAGLKTVVLQFKLADEAALFKLTHL